MERIELLNKLFCSAILISIAILYSTPMPYTIVRYHFLDMGSDSFYLFTICWFVYCTSNQLYQIYHSTLIERRYPFDWKTPVGYLVAWLAQHVSVLSMGFVNIQFPNLVIGSCWFFMFVAKDIADDVSAFNLVVKIRSNENRTKLTKRFFDIVRIHLDAKR